MEDFIKEYTPKNDDRADYIHVVDYMLEHTMELKKHLDDFFKKHGASPIKKVEYCSANAYAYNVLSIMYSKEGEEDDTISRDS